MEDSTPIQVLTDIGRELLEARASIFAVLAKSPQAAEIWQIFERGCMCVFFRLGYDRLTYVIFFSSAWHLGQDRYKLKDLGL